MRVCAIRRETHSPRAKPARSDGEEWALSRAFPLLVGALALALLPATAATAAPAEPKPSVKELKRQLDELESRLDRLIADYNAKRVELAKAKEAEKAAKKRLEKAKAEYEAVRRTLRDIAMIRYQTSFGSPIPAPDPDDAALTQNLVAEQAARLQRFAEVREERRRAAAEAKALRERVADQTKAVAGRRTEAEKLIREIKEKMDKLVPVAPGRRPGGWAPELPSGPDNVTPRTRLMRTEILKRFDLRYPVGCYRHDTMGEHPLGRACDFMLSSGGAMPTPEMQRLGDEIAEWAIKNGRKLGVKYVIWKQRIYHMARPGWRLMADRGGITANHYDHVHISMY